MLTLITSGVAFLVPLSAKRHTLSQADGFALELRFAATP